MSRICCVITLLLYVGVVWGQPAPPGPGFPGGIPTIPNGVTSAPTIPSGTITPSTPTLPSGIATLAPTPTPTPTPSIPTSTIGFDAQIYQVKQIQSENIAQVQLTVVRDGSVTSPARASYQFVDGTARHSLGTAVPTDNYMAGDGTLIFNEGIQELPITFFVIPQQQNGITYFSVVLTNVTGDAVLSPITASTLVYLNVNTSEPNVVLPQPGPGGAITPSTAPDPSTATTAPVIPTVAPTAAPTLFPTVASTEPPTIAPTSGPTVIATAEPTPTPHSNHTNTSVPVDHVVPFTPVVSSSSSSDDHARDIGLGVGIGAGVPVICLALIIACCCIRRKRYTPVAVTEAHDKPKAAAAAAAGMGYDKGKSMEYEVKTADGNPPMINNGAFIAPITTTLAPQQTKTVSFDKTVLASPPSPISSIPTFHRTLPTSSPPLSSITSPHDSHAILRMHSDDGISNSSNTPVDDTTSGITIDSNTGTTPATTPTPTPTGASTVAQSLLATARLPMQGPSSSYLRDPLETKHAVQPTFAGRIADMEKQGTLKPMDICVPLETSDDVHVTPRQQSEPMLASTPRRIATPPLLSEQTTHT